MLDLGLTKDNKESFGSDVVRLAREVNVTVKVVGQLHADLIVNAEKVDNRVNTPDFKDGISDLYKGWEKLLTATQTTVNNVQVVNKQMKEVLAATDSALEASAKEQLSGSSVGSGTGGPIPPIDRNDSNTGSSSGFFGGRGPFGGSGAGSGSSAGAGPSSSSPASGSGPSSSGHSSAYAAFPKESCGTQGLDNNLSNMAEITNPSTFKEQILWYGLNTGSIVGSLADAMTLTLTSGDYSAALA